jgi:predicted DNA-binding protein YlxM (UPF0122 family)
MKADILEYNKKEILKLYLDEDKSQEEISNLFKVSKGLVYYFFKKYGITKSNRIFRNFTNKEKEEIISLYTKDKRGKSYIASLYNCSDSSISYNLKKWGIDNIDRNIIQQKVYQIHGYKSKGFKGKKHSDESKLKISNSLFKNWENTDFINRNAPKSLYINTKIGKVLGSYEVAFIQMFYEENNSYPNRVKNRIKTPIGSYLPDFESNGVFYDVKSDFTYEIYKTSNQFKKIDWISKNTSIKIEIVLISKKDALYFFRKAVDNNIVTDNLIIKNNKYEILNRA